MKSLFEPHIGLASKVLNMQLERQNVTSSNIANIKTQGYKAKTLEFEEELQAALGLDAKGKMSLTNDKHMPTAFNPDGFGAGIASNVQPRIVHGEDRVDMDKEMATMAKTQLQYSALTSILRSNFEGLRTVIQEGQK